MSHSLRALLALAVLAAPGAAFAQCTKDTDCKGDRVCDSGACVSPNERTVQAPPPVQPPPVQQPVVRASPPPPRPAPAPARPPSAWEGGARKNVISTNVLSPISGWLAAGNLQGQYPGLGITSFAFTYEHAVSPNIAFFGTLVPNHWSSPAQGSVLYMGTTLGLKYYFFGEAPAGFWAGGEVGNLTLDLGPGLIGEAGFQWILDFGLQLGVLGGLVISSFGIGLGYGGLIGWSF